ncbi:MAG: replicative DNA helicase [Alphaproteobacteria bacterium]|nr:replicative DNA helicase [Alphaproteobacteria bacterium]
MESSRQAAALSVLARGENVERAAFRTQPRNLGAEQALIGALLVDNAALGRVAGYLAPEHFFHPVHGRIYGAIVALVERGQLADPITLRSYFEQDGALADIGGAEYLVGLVREAVSIINVNDYGRQIHDAALRRSLIHIGEEIVNTAFDFEVDTAATAQIEAAEQRLFDLAEKGEIDGGFVPLGRSLTAAVEIAERAYRRESRVTGVATGLVDLDNLLGGLHPSDLVVLAGRPGMGKTAMATNIGFNAARRYRAEPGPDGRAGAVEGAVVGYFSLEMSAEQLAARMLAEESNVPSDNLRRGALKNEEWERLVEASQRLNRLPFYIDDTPALSVAALRTRARRLKRVHNLGLIVVDYLQLARPSGTRGYDNRVQEVAEITQGLKAMAKELDVPVLALSQLSRAVESREDKRPQLSDLRESGTIEQDADVVLFIYRDEYYLKQAEPKPRATEDESGGAFQERYSKWQQRLEKARGVTDIIVAKHRHGPTGTVGLFFEDRTTRFGNLERNYDPHDFRS